MITNCVGELEYLASPLLATPHGFSTRLGGVSRDHLASLNLGVHRGDRADCLRENYRRFRAATGTEAPRLATVHQIHGRAVWAVTEADGQADPLDDTPLEGDGLVTDRPGVTLMVFYADCVPILFFDPVRRAVGACHAGWRGTAAGVARATVEALEARYGCRRGDIRAAIGPAIGPCCFETDADVPQAMEAALGGLAKPWVRQAGAKYHVDLKAINRAILLDAGLSEAHVEKSDVCTCCEHRRYWSHRYTHGLRGSQAAAIQLEAAP